MINSQRKSFFQSTRKAQNLLSTQISTHHIPSAGYELMSICIILFYLFSDGMEGMSKKSKKKKRISCSNIISNLIRSHKGKYKKKSRERLLKFTQHWTSHTSWDVFTCSLLLCYVGCSVETKGVDDVSQHEGRTRESTSTVQKLYKMCFLLDFSCAGYDDVEYSMRTSGDRRKKSVK